MNFDHLDLFSKDLKQKKIDNTKDSIFTNFINDLQKLINNFIKNSSEHISNNLLENSIHVVRDINDNKLSLVNSGNGQDIDIYIVNSKEEISKLNEQGIFNNIYEMSKEDLYSLNLGSNVTFNDNQCIPYYGELKIENPEAAAKLEDMYFCLEQEKNAIYSVSEISDDKIYLTNTEEGGHFSIPKANYPDFKVGDLVKSVNGKYILI